MKKHPAHKRIIKSILKFFELNYPKFSALLRYHSIVEIPENFHDCEIQTKMTDWIKGDHEKYLKILDPRYNEIEFSKQKIKIYKIETSSYKIYGNIKYPINSMSGKVFRFFPFHDLSLTDAYPLPVYRTITVHGTVILIPNIENYYHLVIDYLLPNILYIIDNHKNIKHVSFILQRQFPLVEYCCKILRSLNITSTILWITPFDQVKGGTLLMRGSFAEDVSIQFVFPSELQKLKTLIGNKTGTTKRIYISRRSARRRRIINENDLIKMISKYNVEVVNLDFSNAENQIKSFRNAELIISPHGAGLTNLIWADHAQIIEIFPNNLTPKHYLNFASQLNLKYTPYISGSADSSENFIIDIDNFEKFLSNVIDQGSF